MDYFMISFCSLSLHSVSAIIPSNRGGGRAERAVSSQLDRVLWAITTDHIPLHLFPTCKMQITQSPFTVTGGIIAPYHSGCLVSPLGVSEWSAQREIHGNPVMRYISNSGPQQNTKVETWGAGL